MVRVFQDPDFSGSGAKVWVQVLEIALISEFELYKFI